MGTAGGTGIATKFQWKLIACYMKVLLLEHIPSLGKKGDVVDVSDGYAKNALFPKKKARIATPDIVAAAHQRQEREVHIKQERSNAIHTVISPLRDHIFIFSLKAGDDGSLFTSLHQEVIVQSVVAFLKGVNPIFEEQDVHMDVKPIKELGVKNIVMRLGRGIDVREVDITIEIKKDR